MGKQAAKAGAETTLREEQLAEEPVVVEDPAAALLRSPVKNHVEMTAEAATRAMLDAQDLVEIYLPTGLGLEVVVVNGVRWSCVPGEVNRCPSQIAEILRTAIDARVAEEKAARDSWAKAGRLT